ncbi:hypothetical protein [uncultured Paludibaculum sp.]|uniref:hypothetical protein n=1 Tax=uncultured Paludibaculum sp. TaxID=1765020 RepID=UPI002AAAFD0B|nr:hypothetical protein [uncultured Paludibaculum sp.]
MRILPIAVLTLLPLPRLSHAQENYEIQVYGSETMPPRKTMLEFHTNFTVQGTKGVTEGMRPTNHAWHETLELTHGFNDWFETGFYLFLTNSRGYGWQWVGDHIRPRVRVPPSWKWPVGVSLSTEIGYQRAVYAGDTWNMEIRPIVDKEAGRWYFSFNPTLDRAFHGPSVSSGVVFSPNFKASYAITRKINFGGEYYGSLGPLHDFVPISQQEQQIIPAVDIDFGPDWEFNFGVGVGVTGATDHMVMKMIIGRRFGSLSWKHHSRESH